MPPRLRIFLSSPGDVTQERLRAHLIIQKLARDYQRYFAIEPFLWEYEPLLGSKHFQDAIDPPSSFDIVLLFLWSRLGKALPEKTELREYRGIDGRAPVTGTEWEFEDALKANRARGGKGPPDLLVYRRMGGAVARLDDLAKRNEEIRQYEALEAFWQRWFKSGDQLLAGYTEYSDLAEFDRRLEADLSRLIERYIKERHVNESSPLWLKGSPFRGLRAYDFGDAQVFFGRDGETREGLARLAEAAARGTALLVVSGPSGAGKSSLARAGLLPSLVGTKAVAEVGLWRRVVMRPGDAGGDPVLALARALIVGERAKGEGLAELAGKQMTAEELSTHLGAGGDPAFLFARTLRDLADDESTKRGMLPHEQARLALLVDQLEELFRPEIGTEQRSRFARAIAALAGSGVVWVIATLRSDLWHRLDEVKELRDLADRGARLALAAPDAAQLFEIIREPAQAAGLKFDADPTTGLALDAMLAKEAAGQPGVLPLLSVMLDDLYEGDVEKGGTGGVLTVASYRALGGLREAIGRRAESKLESLRKADPAAADALPRVLRALVTFGATGDSPTVRPAPLATIADSSPERRLVQAFYSPDARLLTVEDRGKGAEVRLAHEALIENWPRAKAIVGDSASFIRVRDDVEAQRRKWEAARRRGELLLASGLPLAEAEDLVRKFGDELSAELRAFVQASRNRARRRQLLTAAAAAILAVAGVGGLWWWDANLRIKTEYCTNYSERWGAPVCVGPLDAATQAARSTSYRFLVQGGRVLEMAQVNGAGSPTAFESPFGQDEPWTKGVALWRFGYRGGALGTKPILASVSMESSTGMRVRTVSYEFSDDRRQAIVRFDRSFGVAERQAAEGSGLGVAAIGAQAIGAPAGARRSDIGQHRLRFDAGGLLLRRDFEPIGGGGTIADALGSYGRVYEYDALGLPITLHNLDARGDILIEKSGLAGQQRVFDARGDLMRVEWVDREGRLRANQQGFARVASSRNSAGNETGVATFAETGRAINRTDLGFARASAVYDARGNITEVRFFDPDGRPVVAKPFEAAAMAMKYDERGDISELTFYGADGRPILGKNGVARATIRYDERRNKVEEAYFGVDGNPVLTKSDGAARLTYRYDERGDISEVALFGADGKPILSKNGVARVTFRYDERGNKLAQANFGVDGSPVLNTVDGLARATYRYDERGNEVEEAYFGADGKPILCIRGFARLTLGYDERGEEVEEAYFGTDGNPVLNKNGFARTVFRYDERGNQIEWADFGADGQPVMNNSGVARTVFRYDERGNKAEEAYFGVDGAPTLNKYGFARVSYRYDERGNETEWADFGTDGKPVFSTDADVARMTFRYDDRGDKVEEAYFGTDGKPVLRKETGVARVTYRYDGRGDDVEEAYFGVDGRPMLSGAAGVARVAYRYDDRGDKVEEAYFGTDAQPILSGAAGVAGVTYRYDDRGNQIEWIDFDTDGKPICNKYGIARMSFRYDERGEKLEEAYFGADGKPILSQAGGFAREILGYDERGNQVEAAFFGADGNPILSRDGGLARKIFRYDERGNQVEQAFFGTDGSPILSKDGGFARVTSRYDERGNKVEEAYFGTDGKPVAGKVTGAARLSYRYDERGNAVEIAYTDADGKPVRGKDFGVARATFRYDERGNRVEAAFFGTDGAPAASLFGFAHMSAEYDAENRVTKQSVEDAFGRPVLVEQIGAQVRYSYNWAGEIVGAKYVDEGGQLIPVEPEIRQVAPNSVAESVGLASGDRLLAYDGEAIESKEQAVAMVTHATPGSHKLTFRRGDAVIVREVPAGRLGVILANVRAENKLSDAKAPAAADSLQTNKR